MSLSLHLELWESMQEHIVDVRSAADDFVAVLIDHGIDAEKIAKVAINEDIKKALLDYDVDVDVDVDDDDDDFEHFSDDDD
jgi:hypothetical protein